MVKLNGFILRTTTVAGLGVPIFRVFTVLLFYCRDSDIAKKCGHDAVQYLTFQRYLLLYLVVICVLSTAIIVPVNFTGTNSEYGFTR